MGSARGDAGAARTGPAGDAGTPSDQDGAGTHRRARTQGVVHPRGEIPPGPDAPGPVLGRRLGRRDTLWAAVVALVSMAVALAFRSALVPTDPWHYVQGALDFPDGTWHPAGLSRWGFLLPIIPFARLWGDATATYYALPLLSTGLLAAVLYLLGTRFVARTAGVLGAVLALATPLVFVNLTRGYTDLTATTLVGLAILLATLAEDSARRAEASGTGWGWRTPVLLLACGFVTGWSFEVRETAVFAWPVIGWILWRVGRPVRTLMWFVPPALAWLALDMALCALIYDDPLLKVRVMLGADISESVVSSDAGYVGQTRWWYATVLPRSIWEVSGGPALLVALGVGLVGGLVFRSQLGRIWSWGVLTLGLLWLQGGPLDPAHPSVRLDVARYWLSFIVPLMLATAGTIVIGVRRARGGWRIGASLAAAALVAGVLVPALRFATTYPGFAPNGADAMSELRAHLATRGGLADQRVWADWGTQRILPVYQVSPFGEPRWEARRFRSLNRLLRTEPPMVAPASQPRAGDYVVLYSTQDRTCWHCRRAFRAVEEVYQPLPGPGWQPVFTSSAGNLTLYRLGPGVVWPQARPGGAAGPLDGDADEGLTAPGP